MKQHSWGKEGGAARALLSEAPWCFCVTVVAGHRSLKACHEAKAALEVYNGACWMGWFQGMGLREQAGLPTPDPRAQQAEALL